VYTDSNLRSTRWEAGDDEKGPKRRQTRRLSPWWVFLYFFRVIYILTNILEYIQLVTYKVSDREAGDNEKGPKRCQTRRLGPRWFFIYLFCVFYILTIFYSLLYKICDREDGDDENGLKRHVWRRLGPRWVNFYSTYIVLIYIICDRAETTRMGPNDARCVVWALEDFFFVLRVRVDPGPTRLARGQADPGPGPAWEWPGPEG